MVELSEHGIVIIVEETGCLQAKVYLQREVAFLLVGVIAVTGRRFCCITYEICFLYV